MSSYVCVCVCVCWGWGWGLRIGGGSSTQSVSRNKKQSTDGGATKTFQDRGLDYARPISAPHFSVI